MLYFPACAEEAGCLALAAEEAGLHGAAFWPMPSGGVILSSFGGGTASSLIVPAQGHCLRGGGPAAVYGGAHCLWGRTGVDLSGRGRPDALRISAEEMI